MNNRHSLFPLLLLLCISFSCSDNNDETVSKLSDKEQASVIEKAKSIFDGQRFDFSFIQVRSGNNPVMVAFEPVWEEAFVAEHDNALVTVETNILMSHSMHMLTQDSYDAVEESDDLRYMQHLSRTVVLMPQDGKRPLSFLMTIIGSRKYMENHNFDLSAVSYRNIPEDFSGQILYHTLFGDFINGWQVEEGHQFKTCTLISDEDANLFEDIPSTRSSNVACKEMTVYKYYYNCREVKKDKDDVPSYEYRTYEVKPGDKFICNGPFIKAEPYRVCSLLEGNTLPPTYSPGDIIPNYDLSTLFGSYLMLYAQLQGFMHFMEHYDDASRAVLSFIDYVKTQSTGVYQKLNVAIDTTQTSSVRYYSPSNTVYFKSLDDYSDMVMYEELIHNVQRIVYADYTTASLNIEFEAQLIMDYINFVSGADGYTDLALNMKYAKAELRDGRSMTLSEWVKSNAYSHLDMMDYQAFLAVWKDIPDIYQNYMISLRTQPQLLPSIINEINDNR